MGSLQDILTAPMSDPLLIAAVILAMTLVLGRGLDIVRASRIRSQERRQHALKEREKPLDLEEDMEIKPYGA